MQHLTIAFLTWRRHLKRHLVPFGITLKQVYVLRQLARREFLYPSQIAELLFCDRPTATVVIRNMEKRGWVTRRPDDQDRRQVRVAITEQGRAKLSEVVHSQWGPLELQSHQLSCFSESEVAELQGLLGKLSKYLGQIADRASIDL